MADFYTQFPATLDFVHLSNPDQNGKYSLLVLFDSTTEEGVKDIKAVSDAIKEAVARGCTEKDRRTNAPVFAGKDPDDKAFFSTLQLPIKNADKDVLTRGDNAGKVRSEVYPEMKGKIVLTCKTKDNLLEQGLVFGSDRKPVPAAQLYSGMQGRVGVWFTPYDNNGNRGVSARLVSVLRTGDGERLTTGHNTDPFVGFGLPPVDDGETQGNAFDAMGI